MPNPVFTLPNLISFIRILLAPVMLTAAMAENRNLFLFCFAGSLVTDFLDGFLARLLNQMSKLGSQLDTIGDVLMGLMVFAGGFLLWPERMMEEKTWIIASLASLTVSGLITLIRYHHLPSYHTWSAKLSTAVLGVGVWLFFAGVTPWGLRVGVSILICSAVEEILITFILPAWRPNVPHVFRALKLREHAEES